MIDRQQQIEAAEMKARAYADRLIGDVQRMLILSHVPESLTDKLRDDVVAALDAHYTLGRLDALAMWEAIVTAK